MEGTKTVETPENETPAIDSMESNIEEGFNVDPLADVFSNESNIVDMKEEVKPEVKPEEVKTEETTEVKKEELPKVETPEELAAKITGLNAALAAEREKKREAQQRVFDLSQGRQTQEPVKKEFDWKNPEKTIEAIKTDLRQENDSRFLNLSESQCRGRHEDYDEKYKVFVGLAKSNPAMVNTMLAQPDPAEWAYSQATNHLSLQEFGNDPEAYKANLKEQLKAELLAELKNEKITDIENKIKQTVTKLPPAASSITGKVQQKAGPVILDDPLEAAFGDR
jgi:hypothetical protein